MNETLLDLHFPFAGLNVSCPTSQQPNLPVGPDKKYSRTCPVGVNVRGYDAGQSRLRGGSRSGLGDPANLPDDRVPSVEFVIQEVAEIATVGADVGASLRQYVVGYYRFQNNLLDISGNERHLTIDSSATYDTGFMGQGLATGGGFKKPLGGLTDIALSIGAWFYAETGVGGGGGIGFGRGAEVGEAYRISYRSDGANGQLVVRNRTGTNVIEPGFTLALGQWHHGLMTINGDLVTLYVDGASVGTYTGAPDPGWSELTFGANASGSDFDSAIDEMGVWYRPLSAAMATLLFNSGNGVNVFYGDDMQLSQSGRVVTLVAVSQGEVKTAIPGDTSWSATTNNTGETPPLNYTGVMQSAVNAQKLFFADGINYCYYDPATNSVETWTATAGTLPTDAEGNNPRLIATWRGRTLLSGLLKDPTNLFMSAIANPFDFDYAPVSASSSQAVALSAAPQGEVGDVITALIPFSDDVLIIGGDSSIWLLRGDPMSGGNLDLVTDSIGIAYGQAWCQGPDGTVFFLANVCGVFALQPGQQPIRISQAIEPLLKEIDTGKNIIRMAWNDLYQGFHLFITPVDEPAATTHYFYEFRTGAWWQDVFGNDDHNPLCCTTFDGNEPGDRQLLIGCWDGYVRRVDPDAATDDGTAIESEVWIGPLLTKDLDEVLVKDLQAVLGEDTGTVGYAVHVGATAEEALASEAVVEGEWEGGRNLLSDVRRSGHACYVKVTASTPWAMETIRVRLATQGKKRRRGY